MRIKNGDESAFDGVGDGAFDSLEGNDVVDSVGDGALDCVDNGIDDGAPDAGEVEIFEFFVDDDDSFNSLDSTTIDSLTSLDVDALKNDDEVDADSDASSFPVSESFLSRNMILGIDLLKAFRFFSRLSLGNANGVSWLFCCISPFCPSAGSVSPDGVVGDVIER